MHILIIPSWYPEFEGDYVGSFFREQALALARKDCKVGVIYPELKSLRGLKAVRIVPFFRIFDDEGVITYIIKWSNWFIKTKYLQIKVFKFLGEILFQKYIYQNGIPDIIHCQSIFNSGFLGEYLSDKYNIPFVITEHNSGFIYKNQGFQKYYSSVIRIANKANRCFSVSSYYSRHLQNELSSNIAWGVHNNIVSDFFLKTKIRIPNTENFIFLTITRLHKIKNVSLIIESFELFTKQYPNSQLKIIGLGNQFRKLKTLAKNLGIEKKIKFLGRVNRDRIPEEINASHVYLHSSLYETFGVVFVEALSMGRPIVTTDCGGADDIINNQVGIKVKNNNPIEFYKAMLIIYKNYNKYDSLKIREYCESKFSENILTEKLIQDYKLSLKENI